MGNHISCKLASPATLKSSKTAKVIMPTGEVKQLHRATKAAEVMMETTNHFIVDAKSLKIGKRFCPLNADADLSKPNVYALFPMERKNTVVKASDLGALFMAANPAVKRVVRVRVSPETTTSPPEGGGSEECATAVPRMSLDGVDEGLVQEVRHRLSLSRSKKPLLETIDEEHVIR